MGLGALGAAIGGLAGGYAKGVQIRDEMESNALKRQALQLQVDREKAVEAAQKEYEQFRLNHDNEWDTGAGKFASHMPKSANDAAGATAAPGSEATPAKNAAPAEVTVAPVRSPGDAAKPVAAQPALAVTQVESESAPDATPLAATSATAATPAAAAKPADPLAGNPYMKGAGVQYGQNYQSAADQYYSGHARALQNYYIKIGKPELAAAVPEQIDKLRQGDFLRATRGGFAALAAGSEEAANTMVPRVWGMIGDGTDIVPGSMKFDPKTMNWSMKIKGQDGNERDRTMTQREIWSMAEQMNVGSALKFNVDNLTKRADRLQAVQDEWLKPRNVKPGEKIVALSPVTGRMEEYAYGNIPAGYEVMTDAAGNTVLRKIDGGGRSSTGTGTGGSGKAPKTDEEQAVEMVSDYLGKQKNTEAGPAQVLLATDTASRLVRQAATRGQSIPPAMAARVASTYAMNPAIAAHDIDLKTGLIAKTIRDDESGETFVLRSNVGNPLNVPNGPDGKPVMNEKQLRDGANAVLADVDREVPGMKALYQAAAFDKTGEGRKALETQLRTMITEAMGKNPAFAKFTPEQQKAAIDRALGNAHLDQKLPLIQKYGEPPKADKPDVRKQPGGLIQPRPVDPESKAGKWQARQAELKTQAAQAEQQRATAQTELGKQFQADKASMSALDLARKYDPIRGNLPNAEAAELQRIERTIR